MFRKIVEFYNKDRESFFYRLYTRLYGIALQNFLLKKILSVIKMYNEPEDWIIILSNYNSGSTLLRNILSSAKEIAYFPDESVLYTKTIKRPDEEFGWQGDGLRSCNLYDHWQTPTSRFPLASNFNRLRSFPSRET